MDRTWPGVGGGDFQLHAGEAIVHLTYIVYLVDAKTDHVIAWHPGSTRGKEKRNLKAKLLMAGVLSSPHVYSDDARWPEIALEIAASEEMVDLATGGFDAGIRLGQPIAPDMVAVRLTPPFPFVVVGSPDGSLLMADDGGDMIWRVTAE